MAEISKLIGKTLNSIRVSEDNSEIEFICCDSDRYLMYHRQIDVKLS